MLEPWSGGQGWTKILRREFNAVWSARVTSAHLHCHHSNPGNGLLDLGQDYTLILLVHIWDVCMFLIIDAHSKWLEVHPVTSINATVTIQHMRTIFSTFGLPKILVTNNGPSFVSREFEEFLCRNGIRHKTTDPYHPASNGVAERAVQIFKKGIRKMQTGTLQDKIAQFLFSYRNTP